MDKKKNSKNTKAPVTMLCDDLDFVLHEEYRLLRTNIKYSLTDGKACHCIGVTSSVKGEAKTSTAINLAYTLAENGEKVCLLEADMRIPTVRKKLNLEPHVGLSEYLTAQVSAVEIVEGVQFSKCVLPLIQAGAVPPNPAELLSSGRMDSLLKSLSKVFTYIIVDLPPADVVSDAAIVGSKLDGVLMVVAQPICTKRLLKESMKKLAIARVKVLGFVRTFVSETGFGYSKYTKKNYKRAKNYQYNGYAYAAQQINQTHEQEYVTQLRNAEQEDR